MYLKKIEINGFKSFANQTQIDLETGVTGIVGPNGSGKSNITESLRWVLGEQSAKSLRGAKMPDIIFAGSGSRQALGMAEVTLSLDNTDRYLAIEHDEVVITRRLYKTGDSEFLINKKKVRLKDIQGLFMDTGLGRDSFSIISQGKVEEIFNSKPEERRGIFEEAAGVLKYKVRKKEASSKISETNENIERLDDIIYELEQQLAPLKIQSEKAQRYLTLYETFKTKDIQMNISEIKSFKASLESMSENNTKIASELAQIDIEMSSLETENGQLKQKRRQLEAFNEENQNQLLITTQLIGELDNKIRITKERQSFNMQNLSEKNQQKIVREAKIKQIEADLDRMQLENKRYIELIADLKKKINTTQAEMAQFAKTPEEILQELRSAYLKVVQKEADLANRKSLLEQEEKNVSKDLSLKNQQFELLNQELIENQAALDEIKEQLEKQNQELKDSLSKYQLQEANIHKLEKKHTELQKEYFTKVDNKRTAQSKLQSLKSIQENHANYYRGVKEILNRKSEFAGLIGTVAELIDFDTKIEVAVEVALSGVAQQLVVENEAVASDCIRFLKDKKLGRATFLPLTTVKSRSLNPSIITSLKTDLGFVGILSEMIRFDSKLQPVFDNLVGTTVVATDFKAANRMARLARFQVRIVTLTGEVVSPGGSMSGGSRNKQSNFFNKNEIEFLQRQVLEMDHSIVAMESKLKAIKAEVQEKSAFLEEIREKGETKRFKQNEMQLKLNQLEEKIANQITEKNHLFKTIEDIQTEDIVAKIKEIEVLLIETNEKKESIDSEVKSISASQEAITLKRQAIEQDFHQLQSSLQVEQVKFNQLKNDIENKNNELVTLNAEIAQFEALNAQIKLTEDEQVASIQELTQELAIANDKKEQFETTQVQLKFQREDFEAQLEELSITIDALRKEQQKKQTKLAQLEMEIKQLSITLNDSILYLADEYEINNQELLLLLNEDTENIAQIKQEVADLKKAIKKLGNVNLDAIDQYAEINERFEFLTQQKEDLQRAKQLLEATISEIDGEVKTRFLTTFEAIRAAFKKTFPQMFNGGVAELILTNPEDLLNTGIEIEVEPPGKKIQSLNLMSGGEKALTALSLLFAIIKVRTIPFVVLDEVEAALDEANVARFGHYLQTFENKNQFIVVTHRKGTMEACDTLYGVTMHESGVSKIVSVKLKKAEALVSTT